MRRFTITLSRRMLGGEFREVAALQLQAVDRFAAQVLGDALAKVLCDEWPGTHAVATESAEYSF